MHWVCLTRWKKLLKKTPFRVGMDLKKVCKQGGDEIASRTLLPHYGTMPSPSLASNVMYLHP